MKQIWREFSKGFITSNGLFVLCLGNCPALALTTRIHGAIGMGLALAFVMFWTGIIVSAIRRFIPNMVRIPVMIVIAASFVTIVDMVFHGYVPALYTFMGIFLPLIVVN